MEEKKPLKIKFKTAVIIIVTAVVLLGIGANVYASVNGYGNIFFLIKYLVTGEKTEITGKDELLSDRDITISYEPITLTKDIKLQIRNLQIKNDKANLILLVSESNQNDVTPLKYKVYNSQNKVICEQNSKKSGDITQYTEELKLNEFNNDKMIYLEVDNSKNEKITKITINLETREISVEGEKEAVEKISEIKLKDFLGYVSAFEPNKDLIDEKILFSTTLLNNIGIQDIEANYIEIINLMLESCGYEKIPETFESTEFFKKSKYNGIDRIELIKPREGFEPNTVVEIKDISYCGGIYTVKFTYTKLPPEGTMNADLSGLEYKEAIVEFELNTNKDYSEFKVIKFEGVNNTEVQLTEEDAKELVEEKFEELKIVYLNPTNAFKQKESNSPDDVKIEILNYDEVMNNLFSENMKEASQETKPNLVNFIDGKPYIVPGGGFYEFYGLKEVKDVTFTNDRINATLVLRYKNIDGEFLKDKDERITIVRQNKKWKIDSFDLTKLFDVTGENNTDSKEDTNTSDIITQLTPSGFAGSSMHRVELNSNKEVYVKTFDGNGYTDNNVTSRELIAKNVDSISKNNEGSIIIKGGEKVKNAYNWIIFEQEYNDKNISNSIERVNWTKQITADMYIYYPAEFNVTTYSLEYDSAKNQYGEKSVVMEGDVLGKDEKTGEVVKTHMRMTSYVPCFENFININHIYFSNRSLAGILNYMDFSNVKRATYGGVDGKDNITSSKIESDKLPYKYNNLITYWDQANNNGGFGHVFLIETDNNNNGKVNNIVDYIIKTMDFHSF